MKVRAVLKERMQINDLHRRYLTFDFTMDAFPGYTYFDKTKKVLCALQIVDKTINVSASAEKTIFPHNETIEEEIGQLKKN